MSHTLAAAAISDGLIPVNWDNNHAVCDGDRLAPTATQRRIAIRLTTSVLLNSADHVIGMGLSA